MKGGFGPPNPHHGSLVIPTRLSSVPGTGEARSRWPVLWIGISTTVLERVGAHHAARTAVPAKLRIRRANGLTSRPGRSLRLPTASQRRSSGGHSGETRAATRAGRLLEPVFDGRGLGPRSFDHQPFFWPGGASPLVAMGRPNADRGRATTCPGVRSQCARRRRAGDAPKPPRSEAKSRPCAAPLSRSASPAVHRWRQWPAAIGSSRH